MSDATDAQRRAYIEVMDRTPDEERHHRQAARRGGLVAQQRAYIETMGRTPGEDVELTVTGTIGPLTFTLRGRPLIPRDTMRALRSATKAHG